MRIVLVLGLALMAASVALPAAAADHSYCAGEHPVDNSARNCTSLWEWLKDPNACQLPYMHAHCKL